MTETTRTRVYFYTFDETPDLGDACEVGSLVDNGRGLHVVELPDPIAGDYVLRRMTRAETSLVGEYEIVGCGFCEEDDRPFKPAHLGSYRCRSGSLRAGGVRSHCACSLCF